MPRKNRILLSDAERRSLEQTVRTGRHHARTIAHARILLLSDESPDGSSWTDRQIAEALHCAVSTVENVRRRFAREGMKGALRVRKASHHRKRCLTPEARDYLLTLARSAPPNGHARWTLRLLTDSFVAQAHAHGLLNRSISHETIRLTLKQHGAPRLSSTRWMHA